jgi:hypothetical protein
LSFAGLARDPPLGYQLDMLGNSAGVHHRFALALAFGAMVIGLAACPKIVAPDLHTGADGKPKGAKKITLENNEGRGKGVVTYPGGDRVDWKTIELPKDKTGTLSVKLSWQPPRPGLDLSFQVYDEYFWPIAEAKPRKKTKRTSKKIEDITHAKGTYYVMVYASGRGDAGKYVLDVKYAEDVTIASFDMSKLEVPDPPKLPAVPEPPVPCDPKKYDDKNPACKGVCPDPPDPKNPACKDTCPTPPDPNNAACQKTMPCPNPPDRKIKNCMDQWAMSKPAPWPACNFSARDPGNPNCDVKLKFQARVIDVQMQGGQAVITVSKGSNDGVATGWNGTVLDGNRPMAGGNFVVVRVTKTAAVGKVKLPQDKVAHANVELQEP